MIVVSPKQLLPHHSGVSKRKSPYVEVASEYLLERGSKNLCSSQDSAGGAV